MVEKVAPQGVGFLPKRRTYTFSDELLSFEVRLTVGNLDKISKENIKTCIKPMLDKIRP